MKIHCCLECPVDSQGFPHGVRGLGKVMTPGWSEVSMEGKICVILWRWKQEGLEQQQVVCCRAGHKTEGLGLKG